MTTELTIEKEIKPLVAKAQSISIKTKEDMPPAVEMLSNLNKTLDRIVEEKEKVTKPLNEALKAERGRWKPFEVELEESISYLRKAMSVYQTEATRIAKEEEDKIASRIAPGKGNLSMETASKKFDAIERADDLVSTEAGAVKFRKVKKLLVTDASKLPRHYFELNETLLLEDLKKGVSVFGAEIIEVQEVVNSR